MIPREQVIGQRITKILGKSYQPDDAAGVDIGGYNVTHFVYVLENGMAFRMPVACPDEIDPLPVADVTDMHEPLDWQLMPMTKRELKKRLWTATVIDIRIPADIDNRYSDEGFIHLSSGWLVVQLSACPPGIAPSVNIVPSQNDNGETISAWEHVPPPNTD
ncbi:hypothetical protein N9L06_07005 [Mariniblastus sp.]|nr:hypothetical protein [Mariniblastus sp.]